MDRNYMNWINFKEEKPKEPGSYIIAGDFNGKRMVLVASWVLQGDSGFWYACNKVIHWMEIPPPPVIETIQ
jgi:hypothetical protein